MQPDHDPSEEWQQLAEASSRAPFQAPTESEAGDSQNISSDEAAPDQQVIASEEEQTLSPENDASNEDDTVLIRWEAPEYAHHDRGNVWYVIFGIVTLVAVLLAILVMKSITFAILIPVMAVALFIYTRRPPELLRYTLSRKGLHINDRLLPYSFFKSFGVISHAGMHSAVLIPRKRFQLGQTIYFPENMGEQLVDMLASRLPMKEIEPDAIDRLLARLHL